MKCPFCSGELDDQGDEFVCQDDCGAAFMLEYLGMYEEGSCIRIDDGYESEEWKAKWRKS
jgi:hypothetical protein